MSVDSYSFGVLKLEDFDLKFDRPSEVISVLKAWRNSHETSSSCSACDRSLDFRLEKSKGKRLVNFGVCCDRFYYRPSSCYVPESFAVRTPGYEFVLPCMKRILDRDGTKLDQEFLVIPDPVYWQVLTTLSYEKALRFASGIPVTKKTRVVLPASKAPHFYKQLQDAPLNHGSLSKRSGGKNTFFRQIALGKRCELSARAMIVPDTDLNPNEITLPKRVAEQFRLEGRWIILNRMPSLQPENFVALRVAKTWEEECFGVPPEILFQIAGDFDGDEVNLYIVRSSRAQAECEFLLDSEKNAGSTTLGLKLHPCQDMLVVYRGLYESRSPKLLEAFPFSPSPLSPSLEDTMRAVYDLEGSEKTFECFLKMKRLYLREMQDEWMFGLSATELVRLEEIVRECDFDFDRFSERVEALAEHDTGCLLRQMLAGAKGELYHVFLMVGSIGGGGDSGRKRMNSLWNGLTAEEAIPHALASFAGFKMSNSIWIPGYDFYKNCFCLQGLTVNYEGSVVDGKRTIEKNASDACHHDTLISNRAFQCLFRRYFDRERGETASIRGRECSKQKRKMRTILENQRKRGRGEIKKCVQFSKIKEREGGEKSKFDFQMRFDGNVFETFLR